MLRIARPDRRGARPLMRCAETQHRPKRGEHHFTAVERGVIHHWPAVKIDGIPTVTAAGPVLTPIVNHGRWIVNCPFCPSAEYASLEDRRFFCTDCGNPLVGGAWLPVRWPAHHAEIERLLVSRPRTARNWMPHESLKDLERENVVHRGGI